MSMLFLNFILLFFLPFFNFSITEANNNNKLEYLKHSCLTNKTFPPNSATYQSNLHTLLTSLSPRAATTEFYNFTAPTGDPNETIYGMFMCRGDIASKTCQDCIAIATHQIVSFCPNTKEAIIWYHECLVRYSNRSFFSKVDMWPRLSSVGYKASTNLTKEGSYGWLLASSMSDAVSEAANSGPVGTKKFAMRNVSLAKRSHQKVYSLVQCTPDLSTQDCSRCLSDIMKDIPLCCLGTDGGMVLYPSCSLMFGLHRHFRVGDGGSTTFSTDDYESAVLSGEWKTRTRKIIIPASVPIVAFLMLFLVHWYFRRILTLRRYKAILIENFGNESTTLESLQFDLATIEEATNKFCSANMIGKGGFGEVYKVKPEIKDDAHVLSSLLGINL